MDVHMNGNDNGSRKTPVQDDDDMMYQTPHGQSSYCASSTGCSDGGETPNEYHLYAGSSASRFAAGKKRHAQTTDPSNLDNTNNNDGRFTKKRSPSDTDEIAWNSGSVYGDNDHYGDLVYGEAHAQMDACISQVESPDAIKADGKASNFLGHDQNQNYCRNDEEAMQTEYSDNIQDYLASDNHPHDDMVDDQVRGDLDDHLRQNSEQDETPWESFCKDVGNDSRDELVPNLQAYIKAKERRFNIRAEFEQALDECMENLRNSTEGILAEGASICEEYTSRLDEMEADVTSLFLSNHRRRKNCFDLIQKADAKWKQQLSTLVAKVLAEEEPTDDHSQAGHEMHQMESRTETNPNMSSGNFTSTDKAEPEWEEICDNYEPCRNNITAFLGAREARRGAMDSIQDFNDEIHAAIRNDVLDSILQIALSLHQDLEPPCLDMEEEIEANLMENHRRRQELRQKLFESEQRAQGMFATLQARLSHQHVTK